MKFTVQHARRLRKEEIRFHEDRARRQKEREQRKKELDRERDAVFSGDRPK